jgi:hypothetical protein
MGFNSGLKGLTPPFTITEPILIAILQITSDLQVNQVTPFLCHVMACHVISWYGISRFGSGKINLQPKFLHWHCNGSIGILLLNLKFVSPCIIMQFK